LPILIEQQRAQLRPELLEVIENGKSGLSLNDIVGCPLDCGFSVRHPFDNCGMKVALCMDEQRTRCRRPVPVAALKAWQRVEIDRCTATVLTPS
jgi:hypothetical protein